MREWGIRTRIFLLTLIPTLIISLILGIYFTSNRLNDLEITLRDRGLATAQKISTISAIPVFARDITRIQNLTNELLDDPDIRAISIFDREGKLMAGSGSFAEIFEMRSINDWSEDVILTDNSSTITYTAPVRLESGKFSTVIDPNEIENIKDNEVEEFQRKSGLDCVIGWVNINIDKGATTLHQYQIFFLYGTLVLLGIAISTSFSYKIGNELARPISDIADAAEKIKNGDFNTRVYAGGTADIQHLESSINSMAAALKMAHEEMQQNVEQATSDLRQTLETIEVQNIELDMARKDAEKASKVKSDFLANMSHEIRTPLNGIVGFINLLLKTKLDHRQQDYLNTIKTSSSNLLSIINDILDFSKIEAGKLKLDHTRFDIRECIEETLTLMAANAHQKNIELTHIVYSDIPQFVFGDPLRLRQILTNLINNAIKFTHQGSIVVRAMLDKDSYDTSKICISVTDTGIGIKKEKQKGLFEAFKQADSTTTRKFGGTGLGLAISKRLVNKMGGEIGIDSEEGKGATFWFTFVVNKDQTANMTQLELHTLKDVQILLSEAHPVTRASVSHILSNWGAEVTSIEGLTVEELPTYLQQGIQLILLGEQELISRLDQLTNILELANQNNCAIGILANTTSQADYNKLFSEYKCFFIAKPIRTEKLYQACCSALEIDPMVNEYNQVEIKQHNINEDSHNISILAVDDNEANLKLVSALLEEIHLTPYQAGSGEQAIQLCKEIEFDLIFMDIQMPNMDGIEVTKILRTEANLNKKTPIIALTAHSIAAEKQLVINAGMNDCLLKPLKEEEMHKVLHKWTSLDLQQDSGLTQSKPEPRDLTKHKAPPSIARGKNNTNPSIDWQLSLKLVNQQEKLAIEMLQGLSKELTNFNLVAPKLLQNKQINDLKSLTHQVHGVCCYCGTPKLKDAIHNLETACIKYTSNVKKTAKTEKTGKTEKIEKTEKTNEELSQLLTIAIREGVKVIQEAEAIFVTE